MAVKKVSNCKKTKTESIQWYNRKNNNNINGVTHAKVMVFESLTVPKATNHYCCHFIDEWKRLNEAIFQVHWPLDMLQKKKPTKQKIETINLNGSAVN